VNRFEARIFQGSRLGALGDDANQRNSRSKLTDASAQPAMMMQSDERPGGWNELFIPREILKGFTALGSQRQGSAGHLQK